MYAEERGGERRGREGALSPFLMGNMYAGGGAEEEKGSRIGRIVLTKWTDTDNIE
jgi:hypothetical protein